MIQSRQIEAFRAVMLTGAMTSAAKAIHVSQPAISRLVRDLEAELGLALFHRRGSSVVPTVQAHSLMAEVERHFVGLAQIRTAAADIRSGRRASLRIAVLPAMAAGYAPRFVAEFCRQRQDLSVSIEGLPSNTIRDGVANGTYDIGITAVPFHRESLVVYPLEDRAVVIIPPNHRLVKKQVVTAQDLRSERFVSLSKPGTHPIHNIQPPAKWQQAVDTQLSMIACVLVSERVGVAIVDPFSASEFVGRGVVVRPLEPVMTIGTAVVRSRGRRLSTIAQVFLDEFLEHVRQFLARAEYYNS